MLYILVFFHSLVLSKGIEISSDLDTNRAFIGETINWLVKVKADNKDNYRFPKFSVDNDTLRIKKKESQNNKYNEIIFEIVSWDTGSFTTPNYFIEILGDEGEIDFVMDVPRLDFLISSILPTLNEQGFRPLKGPVPVKNVWPVKKIILFILIIFTLYGILVVWRRREAKQYSKLDYTFLEDPKDRALRRLQELSISQFTKDYYTQLSHISREFIETKYFIRTLEMTTQEIEEARSIFPMEDSQFDDWVGFLSLADQVKYALEIPGKEKMIDDKEKIKSFINIL